MKKRAKGFWLIGIVTAAFAFFAALIYSGWFTPVGNYKVAGSYMLLTFLAGVAAVVMGGVTFLCCRRMKINRGKVMARAMVFPFACVAWSFAVWQFQAIVNERVFNKDHSDGEYYKCILPNGYGVTMCDVTEYGMLYNARTSPDGSAGICISEGKSEYDGVVGVCKLQIADRYLFGFSDENAAYMGGGKRYFLLDTRTDSQKSFKTEQELRQAAKKVGIELRLEPIFDAFKRYRYTWFDTFADVLGLVPPVLGFGYLIFWIIKKRKEG